MDLKWCLRVEGKEHRSCSAGGFHFPCYIYTPRAMDNSNIANLQPISKTMSVRNLGKMAIDSTGFNDMDEREKGIREKGRVI
ncbi:hypothetical protein VN97_g393 [Penicillium thymicola]|uniref:Uncharacterized protein n=1 Tax=Penicillium thymicola TaxID=293382 RepID=A0AAI9XDE2_PENTH|nr:hypothetical protein VN97_g393 [Penicillium thymicola]